MKTKKQKGKGWFEGAKPTPTEKGIRNIAPIHYIASVKKKTNGVLRVPILKSGRKPPNFWGHDTILSELQAILIEINHFPTQKELNKMDKKDLVSAIGKHGGINHFRSIFGYELLIKPSGYWTYENTLKELKELIVEIGHFPSQQELKELDRGDLESALQRYGGINHFRTVMGYDLYQKPDGYWTHENTLKELKELIVEIGHFPEFTELKTIGRKGLIGAITKNGGMDKFRISLGYDSFQKPDGYWTYENTLKELKEVIAEIGHFPSQQEIYTMRGSGLENAIKRHGGYNHFRTLLKYNLLKRHWSDIDIYEELQAMITKTGRFPTQPEFTAEDKQGLLGAIIRNGGMQKFREYMGYESLFQKYISELRSYTTKRGKKTEDIIKKILTEWAKMRGLPNPEYNEKLTKGNFIEFVCEVGKKVGIDVTNTMSEGAVRKKWLKKDYYKYLDELWVVVFSDSFTSEDYRRWNEESPKNVKVMSIQEFLEELDYSIDEATKCKIDKFCKCTFRTKDEFIKRHLNRSIEDYV